MSLSFSVVAGVSSFPVLLAMRRTPAGQIDIGSRESRKFLMRAIEDQKRDDRHSWPE